MILHIVSSLISLSIMAICLYFAVVIDAKYKLIAPEPSALTDLAKLALYKAAPLAGACVMAVKAIHYPVGYVMAFAVFSCIFLYEFIRLKITTNT